MVSIYHCLAYADYTYTLASERSACDYMFDKQRY